MGWSTPGGLQVQVLRGMGNGVAVTWLTGCDYDYKSHSQYAVTIARLQPHFLTSHHNRLTTPKRSWGQPYCQSCTKVLLAWGVPDNATGPASATTPMPKIQDLDLTFHSSPSHCPCEGDTETGPLIYRDSPRQGQAEQI